MSHDPVLLSESLHALAIQPNGVYVDGTFGCGGHSQAILKQLNAHGRLIAFDKDPAAMLVYQEHLFQDSRMSMIQKSFIYLTQQMQAMQLYGHVNGILLDLGVSSPQLDIAERGFSFMKEGPLDMRMNTLQAMSAANFVNHAELTELIRVFKEYGEERFATRIANAIVRARAVAPIHTTLELAALVKQAHPKWEKHKHPATRVFQAIRMYVNQELTDLNDILGQVLDVLAIGGRLAVISFHSLEDRLVKQFMRSQEQGPMIPIQVPLREDQLCHGRWQRIGKAIKPSAAEIAGNIRSRSAILRVGEKIA